MEVASLNVVERNAIGGRAVRAVRAAGEVPGVIYGGGEEPASVSVPGRDFARLVLTHHRLFELHYPGGRKVEAYLQDLQWDPLEDLILHADFKRIDLSRNMQVEVDLHFIGQPKGLAKNGVFDATLSHVRIECLPRDLPEEIRINVNDLDVGQAIHLRDLPLPPGVTAVGDGDLLVCQCKLRHATVEEESAPPAEGPAEPEVIGREKKEEEEEGD
jgi:large subunit ribosomal protein L25